jgi:glycosyltransferase involved in cell wall biosynthesis
MLDPVRPETRARIALIVDVSDWALSNIARQISSKLSREFHFEIFPYDAFDNPVVLTYMLRNYTLSHYLWREPLALLYDSQWMPEIENLFGGWENFAEEVLFGVRTCTVYDHLYLDAESIRTREFLFNSLVTDYTVSSKRLYDIYRNIPNYPAPAALTSDGVDLAVFRPSNLSRLEDVSRRTLRIGWVGNTAWGGGLMEDPKGFQTILLPTLEKLTQAGVKHVPVFADRQKGMIDHNNMPSYYASIDVLICASSVEGTPNPVLEAMACGVPVISTNVGVVPDALGPFQRQFILSERSVGELYKTLMRLVHNPDLFPKLSLENLVSIVPWDWSVRVQAFREFFQSSLRKAARNR